MKICLFFSSNLILLSHNHELQNFIKTFEATFFHNRFRDWWFAVSHGRIYRWQRARRVVFCCPSQIVCFESHFFFHWRLHSFLCEFFSSVFSISKSQVLIKYILSIGLDYMLAIVLHLILSYVRRMKVILIFNLWDVKNRAAFV